jgi:CRP-like cAMP-binding protein
MDKEILRNIISQVVEMDDEAWQAALPCFRFIELRKKEYFVRQGEICKYIGFITKGYTRLFYNLEHEEVTKDFNVEGCFCGSYASFIAEAPSHFNVIAMEPLQLLIINRNQLLELTDRYMSWQKFLRIAMSEVFIQKENREAMFLTTTSQERYTNLVKHKPDWVNRIPLKYLASYLGMVPETISRIRARK